MTHLAVRILDMGDPGPAHPDVTGRPVTAGDLTRATLIEDGTTAGKPAVCFLIEMPDGSLVFTQTTAAIFRNLNAALVGALQRWGCPEE